MNRDRVLVETALAALGSLYDIEVVRDVEALLWEAVEEITELRRAKEQGWPIMDCDNCGRRGPTATLQCSHCGCSRLQGDPE